MLADFYGIIQEGLKDKLGCVLFQMPPKITFKEEKLAQIIESLDPSFKNVVEFRNESWWNASVYNKLSQHKVTFFGMHHPNLPDEIIKNSKVLYYRLHEVPELYKSRYKVKLLQKIADEINDSEQISEAFIYFNNDIGCSAIFNAMEMENYIEEL